MHTPTFIRRCLLQTYKTLMIREIVRNKKKTTAYKFSAKISRLSIRQNLFTRVNLHKRPVNKNDLVFGETD